MTPTAEKEAVRQMEFEKIQVEKEIVAQLRDLDATLRALASILENKA